MRTLEAEVKRDKAMVEVLPADRPSTHSDSWRAAVVARAAAKHGLKDRGWNWEAAKAPGKVRDSERLVG